MSAYSIFLTTFLATAVEVIEMVIIVVGVGTVRGWRSTWLGAGAGLALLTGLVLALKTALTAIPINALRLVVGALLLVFGLQWLRKGIRRVSANGFRGMDGAIPVLVGWYALAAVGYVWLLRRDAVSLATPEVTR